MANVSSSNGLEKYPKLRFKGFSDPYRIVPLGDVACEVSRTDPTSKAPVMMLSAGNGFIMQSEKYSRDNAGQSLKKYTLLKKGELAYNHGASKAKQFGCCYQLEVDEALVPFVYHCFSVNKEYAPYVSTVLNISTTERQLKRLVSSSVRMDGLLNISYDDYMTVELALPSMDEQQKVSCFLSLLDEKIKKQQQLVEHLKKYKRGVIKAVFSGKLELSTDCPFDNWETKLISECLSYEQPQKYIVDNERYDESFATPVLTANKAFILGYTEETHGIYDKGDVIIYDDFTMDMKYVTFNFKVKSSTIKMLTSIKGNDLYFMYSLLQSLELQPEGHQRSYISKVEPMTVKIPPYAVQLQISNFLKQLANRVDFEESKLNLLAAQKQGFLQGLFL